MFIVNTGRIEDRMAILLGIGLEEANLTRMISGEPVAVRSNLIKVDGCNMMIFYAGTGPETFKTHFDKVAQGTELPSELKVIHQTDQHYFLVPLVIDGKTLYCVGLTDQSIQNMRDGGFISYRMRIVEGEGDNYEVLIFSGKDAASMKEQFSDFAPATKEYVCADCGLETNEKNGPCTQCKGYRIVLISFVESKFGSDWRKAFEPQ